MAAALRLTFAAIVLFAGAPGGPLAAMTLELPETATLAGEDLRAVDRLLLPTGPRSGRGGPGQVAEGRVSRRVWVVPGAGLTPFQLLEPIAAQFEAMGFEPLFECRDRECGGFDFRLALDLLSAPAMHVDLGDFRYFVAKMNGGEGTETVSVVTSRSRAGGHIHLTYVSPPRATAELTTRTLGAAPQGAAPTDAGLAERLAGEGHAALDGLVFRPGSSELGDGPFAAIEALAAWLAGDAARTIVLVGHSDNVGSLDDNIRLSERRAASVADVLVRDFGVAPNRIAARGVGFLAPIATNATEEGRRLNRRVEAVAGAP